MDLLEKTLTSLSYRGFMLNLENIYFDNFTLNGNKFLIKKAFLSKKNVEDFTESLDNLNQTQIFHYNNGDIILNLSLLVCLCKYEKKDEVYILHMEGFIN